MPGYLKAAPLAMFVFLGCSGWPGAIQERPNFVFILTDDHAWSELSFAMDPTVADGASSYLFTPNMARLAESGMRFTSGYSPAPLCTPTRRSIFCGMTPARQRGTEFKGEFDWEGRLTIPKALKQADADYVTAHFGKFGSEMGASPEEVGFDESDGWTRNATGGMGTPPRFRDRGESIVKDDPKLAFTLAERAIDFMERRSDQDQPFYLQISHYATHLQVQTRQSSLEKFEAKGTPDRAITHAFAGMLFDLDESIGLVLDAIQRRSLEKSTYVILMADNGGRDPVPGGRKTLSPPNRPLRGAKHNLFEGGIRVPFLVAGPGVKAGSVSRTPVTGYDLLPTLYDLAGGSQPLPPEVDGGSFRPVLEAGGVGAVKRSFAGLVFHRPLRANDPSSAIRVGDHKLLLQYATPERPRRALLFDLESDLGEHTDLSARLPEKAAEMEELLLGYLESVDAETPKE